MLDRKATEFPPHLPPRAPTRLKRSTGRKIPRLDVTDDFYNMDDLRGRTHGNIDVWAQPILLMVLLRCSESLHDFSMSQKTGNGYGYQGIRHSGKNKFPKSCLSHDSSSALHQKLHTISMRILARLEDEPKFDAILGILFIPST